MDKKLAIEMGGLGDPIAKQLRAQGIRLPGHVTASLERTRRAIWQCGASNVLPPKPRIAAERRFLKLVAQVIADRPSSDHSAGEQR